MTQHRGQAIANTGIAPYVVATIHPSAVLRMSDAAARHEAHRSLAADLAVVARLLTGVAGAAS